VDCFARTVGDVSVGSIAFGAAGLSLADQPDDDAAVRTIRAAVDAGVRLIDTALAYTTVGAESHSESLIRKALRPDDDVLVATKGGHFRAAAARFPIDGRPETLRRHCDISLRTLGVQRIGLYHLHHPDPTIPFADSIGTLRDLRAEGKIALLGISNVDIDQIEQARAITDIASVQNHFSLYDDSDRATLDHCTDLGIAYLAYSPLKGTKSERISAIADEIAQHHGVSRAQVVLSWNLRQSDRLVCIVGATRARTIEDSVRAPALELTADDIARLSAAAAE
jgi:aryl-alcohol dehydrogenase-like predicted oxidoreductase